MRFVPVRRQIKPLWKLNQAGMTPARLKDYKREEGRRWEERGGEEMGREGRRGDGRKGYILYC